MKLLNKFTYRLLLSKGERDPLRFLLNFAFLTGLLEGDETGDREYELPLETLLPLLRTGDLVFCILERGGGGDLLILRLLGEILGLLLGGDLLSLLPGGGDLPYLLPGGGLLPAYL
jgi:hypothetical protein